MSFPVRDECSNGHKYAEVGYYESHSSRGFRSRSCKQCHRDRNEKRRTYFREHKAAARLKLLEGGQQQVRFRYRHPESGRFASVLFQEIPAGIFDIAARRNWSQQPEMIGWLYLMWKFHLPSWTAAERMEFNEFMAHEEAA